MARTLRYLFVLLCLGVPRIVFGQSTPGEISGVVVDDKKEPVVQAIVQAVEGGIIKGGAVTDIDGNYSIKPIDAGRYDVTIKALNFKETTVTGVIVSPDKTTGQNFSLEPSTNTLNEHVVIAYKVPLIDPYAPGGSTTFTSEQIEKMPTRETNDVAASATGVYQQQRGGQLNIGGARTDGTLYIIDGVQVQGTQGINVSQNSIDQMEVMTSGLSAKYGDASGGVISITTKGVSQKYTGSILLQHSIDGYNNNLANFSISGPIIKKKLADGTKKPVMGFMLSGDVYDDHDRYPTYDEQYVTKGNVLSNLQQNPLHITTDVNGNPVYYYASQFITNDQLTQTKISPQNVIQEGRLNGKLDFQLSDNISITAGGMFDYTKTDLYSRGAILFASDAIPVQNEYTSRGYIRFTQRFGKGNNATGDKPSTISNAYYSIQGDFQNEHYLEEDPVNKTNIFNYAYVGKFNDTYTPQYIPLSKDSTTGRTGTIFQGNQLTQITYNRSDINPVLANYTTQYYNSLNGTLPTSTGQIEASNALVNGDLPLFTYGLFDNVGQSIYFYQKFNSNQYSLSVDASFDLQTGKTRHSIEFGLYYQQRVENSYTVQSTINGQGTQSLWQLMRQLTNTQIYLDKANPVFVINGQHYTASQIKSGAAIPNATDTILYNYASLPGAQSTFDKNLREKLNLDPNGTDMINIDALAPSTFSLNMFSADELLNSGNTFVNYQGYTYAGGAQTGSVNFNDFFTQKDANGNYTRPIAPFSPNYIAGYILDKFSFKDIHFNVGLRIERYDANTSVLIDPYSLYQEKTVGQVPGADNSINGGTHPANIGSNYVVYVNDPTSPNPVIAGYRNGVDWYDPKGNLVQDPSVLNQYTGGKDPIPYLVNPNSKISDSTFDPTKSFTNYTPQVNVLPRVSFSFPVSDVASFYAHYDIYSQRPTSGIGSSTPFDYYYLTQNSNKIINNPDLLPQLTVDYEVGFQQKLSDQSAVTISGFYKERKDMITIVPYIDAYPTTYYSYGNRDFSTTKGMTLKYDLRRISHLRLTLSYTLQFAEGTGSTPLSGNGTYGASQVSPNGLLQNFIEAGLPNLRYISVLDYDSRHNLNANLDYRYNEDEGPIVGGMHILQNAGVNLIFKARSGEPYTRYLDPDNVSQVVIGGVNGSRLPWHYDVDMRIDKDFALSVGKRHKDATGGVKPKKPLYLNVFIYAQNLLNTKDILKVYGYTSRPGDNGYITSSFGQQYVPQQVNPTSYTDLFNLAYNDPTHINYARTISLGVQFNF